MEKYGICNYECFVNCRNEEAFRIDPALTVQGINVVDSIQAVQDVANGKAAASHTHAQADITGLADALNGKADASHTHSGYASTSHTHAQADITGLAGALGGKAAASPHATTNIMDFVEFASSGNAQDFGDLSFDQADAGGASDSHGGLGGF